MRFLSLSLKEGLSQISVLQIYEDSDGYLWFGTRNGLNRYNGYEFEVFRNVQSDPFSLGHNHITSLCEAGDGSLWVGTMMGLYIMDRYSGVFQRDFTGLKTNGREMPAHQHIYSIFRDVSGRMWVGFEDGLYLFDFKKETCTHINPNGLLEKNPVRAVLEMDNGNFLLATTNTGLICLDETHQIVKHYQNNTLNDESISSNFITTLFINGSGDLWVGTRYDGLNKLIKGTDRFIKFNTNNSGLSNNEIRCVEDGNDGNILVGTFNGLNELNQRTGSIQVYNKYRKKEGDLNHFSIYSILKDKAGTIWVGSYSGGINYHSPFYHRFKFHDPGNEGIQVFGIVGPMVEHNGVIWIATEGGGLVRYDKGIETYHYFRMENTPQSPYFENIIKALFLDGDTIWCGTAKGAVFSFDINKKTFKKRYELNRADVVYSLHKDLDGNLYIGTIVDMGLTMIKPNGEQVSDFLLKDGTSIRFSDVRMFYEVNPFVFLIGTRYQGLYQYNSREQTVQHFFNDANMPGEYITSVIRTSNNRIWVGTFGGGIGEFVLGNGFVSKFNTSHGLLNDYVCSMQEGNNGRIWISTTAGLSEFDVVTGKFRNFTHLNGIRVNEFTLHSSLKSESGVLYFSGNNGFISFNPSRINTNSFVPPVYLTNLTVNNRLISVSEGSKILTKPLSQTKSFVLKHDDANFTISYNALNYIFPERNHYAYMLEGFDSDWIDAGIRRTAYYTNIPHGNYTFRVKASNNDNVWNERGCFVHIKILPPLWKTKGAYVGYFVLFFLLFGAVLRYFKVKQRLENDLHRKQLEKQTLEEFHQERMQLFTNFSHELRTPLTLILGPLDDLLNRVDADGSLKETYRLMHRNAIRLYNLVNQLMDFRKKEQGKLSLNLKVGNYKAFIQELMIAFSAMGKERNISLGLKCDDHIPDCMFDPELMEKVIFNLLSNSFKSTPDGGSVELFLNLVTPQMVNDRYADMYKLPVKCPNQLLEIVIKDSGIGIDSSELEKIFDPFYQVKKTGAEKTPGTGLGLSLSRGIVELHQGAIWAGNNPSGGALFQLVLPVFPPDDDTITPHNVSQSAQEFIADELDHQNKEGSDELTGKFTILIVEDNNDVRLYLEQILKAQYGILLAVNGQQGLEMADKHLPDLILSDVMMPKMDGLEFCALIKKRVSTSHIPVILITARSSFMQIREGLETGADDYITKPFSGRLLQLKVRNLIMLRERMKELYGKRFTAESLGIKVASADENFLRIISDFIQHNLSNPELNIDLFCNEVGMSRANLYRKIKAVTGFAPTEFVRNVRLETAASLLKETEMNISEIADQVGFSSLSYFSNCFKSLFNKSPKEFKDSLN